MSRAITSPDASGVNFQTVTAANNFDAGDLIYFGSGGYGRLPTSALPANTSFTATKSAPAAYANSNTYFNDLQYNGGMGAGVTTAVLSNGNIVFVYPDYVTGYPTFKILNPSTLANVVNPTTISSTYVMGTTRALNISVAAFSGGNFVVVWGNSAGGTASVVNYAIYNNSGVLVVAATQDTGGTSNSSSDGYMRVGTFPNGGFVIAYGSSATAVKSRTYNSSGTAVGSWTTHSTVWLANSAGGTWGLAIRSDNTYLVAGRSNTDSNVMYYWIYDSSGALVTNSSFAGTNNLGGMGQCDCCTLSDGTTFVVALQDYYSVSTNYTLSIRFIPTGNVVSSSYYVPATSSISNWPSSGSMGVVGTSGGPVRATALPNNKVLCICTDDTSQLVYTVFDNTGSCLLGQSNSSVSTNGMMRALGPGYLTYAPVQVAAGASNAVLFAVGSPSTLQNIPSVNYAVLNYTTYNLSLTSSVSASITTTAPAASSFYAPGSTPSLAKFAPVAGLYLLSGNNTANSPPLSTILYASDGNGENTIACDIATLSNGQVALAWINNSGGIKVNFFTVTSSGFSLNRTVTVTGTSFITAGQTVAPLRVVAMNSGQWAICWSSGAAQLSVAMYNSSDVQIGSTFTQNTFVNLTWTIDPINFDMEVISGNRVAVIYPAVTTKYPTYVVLNSSCTSAATGTIVSSTGTSMFIGRIPSGFLTRYKAAGGNNTTAPFFEFSANTFTLGTTTSLGSTTALGANRVKSSPNGVCLTTATNGLNGWYGRLLYAIGGTGNNAVTMSSAPAADNTGRAFVGWTASGAGVGGIGFVSSSGNSPYYIYLGSPAGMINATTGSEWFSTSSNVVNLCFAGVYGNLVMVAYIYNTTLGLGLISINGQADSVAFTTSDPSAAVPVNPQTTATAATIPNYTLAGVSVTSATTGNTGVIQTSGVVNLNSNYPNTTNQGFDYTGYAAPGIKGTISGRTMNIKKV